MAKSRQDALDGVAKDEEQFYLGRCLANALCAVQVLPSPIHLEVIRGFLTQNLICPGCKEVRRIPAETSRRMIVDVEKVDFTTRQEHVGMPTDMTREPCGATFPRPTDEKVGKKRVELSHHSEILVLWQDDTR